MARRLSGLLPIFSLLLLARLAAAQPEHAQAAPAQPGSPERITLGQAAVALNGPWKFHIGDSPIDPRTGKLLWTELDFDDSQWETVDLTPKEGAINPIAGMPGYVPGWTAKGHPGYWGYAWYRIRVRVDAPPGQQMALAGPLDFDDAYQFFANGSLLGGFGDFNTSRPRTYYSQPAMFRLPGSGASQVLAFRFWMDPSDLMGAPDVGGLHSAPVLGDVGAVALTYQSKWLELIRAYSAAAIVVFVFGLLAILAFSLILFDRSDSVYLWMGLLFLLTAANAGLTVISEWSQLFSVPASNLLSSLVFPLSYAAWVIVWWIWFGRGVFRWLPHMVVALTVLGMACSFLGYEVFFGLISHAAAARFYQASTVISLALFALLAWIVVHGIRRQGLEGWLVLPVVLLRGIGVLLNIQVELAARQIWFPFGAQIGLRTITDILIALVIALLLLRRLVLSLKSQRQMALDVRQAQEVQQVILPEQRVVFHGFEVESEYRPAREVGGDFFQVIPNEKDGSLLIVAGDVTGKGLKAGMLVALLVGAIRSTADWSADPVVILKALNQRLMGRGDAQATCLALRIDADGSATLANAGHMPPYLNGKPIEVEGSLPLGMIDAPDFSVLRFKLAQGDRLMLLSDGIAEATNAEGHLFGFERVQELIATAGSAAHIATAAQSFGQEDDISVIAVTRTAALQPA